MTRITTRVEVMGKWFFEDLVELINSDLKKALPDISNSIKSEVTHLLYQDPTTKELLRGNSELVGVLGLDNASSRVDDVIHAVVNNLRMRLKPFRVQSIGRVNGELEIGILQDDLAEIRNLTSAKIPYDGGFINWVEMMCVGGDRIYGFGQTWLWKPDKQLSGSRTSHSLIIDKNARAIRVPPEHSGTLKNCWLKRALDTEEFYSFLENLIFNYI